MNADRQPIHSAQLPASSFPDRADVYVCDNCGRDVTKYLHRLHGHSSLPLGPQRHVCRCGQKWLTGRVEWDHLGDEGRRNHLRGIVVCIVVFSIPSSVLGATAYLVLHYLFSWKGAMTHSGSHRCGTFHSTCDAGGSLGMEDKIPQNQPLKRKLPIPGKESARALLPGGGASDDGRCPATRAACPCRLRRASGPCTPWSRWRRPSTEGCRSGR